MKSLSNLVDNFVKYKTKNRYGDLENHSSECMCVDHLIKKRTSESIGIKKLLDNIKLKQKSAQGAVTKKSNFKAKTKIPTPQQKPNTTKISRNNMLLDKTPSS